MQVLPVVALSCAVLCAAHAYRSSSSTSSSSSSTSTFSFNGQGPAMSMNQPSTWSYNYAHQYQNGSRPGAGAPPVKGFAAGNPPPRGSQGAVNWIASGSSSSQPQTGNSGSSSSSSSASTFSFNSQGPTMNRPPPWTYPYAHQYHHGSHPGAGTQFMGFPRPGGPNSTVWSQPPHGSQSSGLPPGGSQGTDNRIGSGSSSSQSPTGNSVNAASQCQKDGKVFNVGDKWTPPGGCARHTCSKGGKTSTLGCPSLEATELCSLTPEDSRQPWPLCCPQLKCPE